jgi:hypothetical protein
VLTANFSTRAFNGKKAEIIKMTSHFLSFSDQDQNEEIIVEVSKEKLNVVFDSFQRSKSLG